MQTNVPTNEQIQEAIERINQEKANKSMELATTVDANEVSATITHSSVLQPTTGVTDPPPTEELVVATTTKSDDGQNLFPTTPQQILLQSGVNLLDAPTLVNPVDLVDIQNSAVIQAQDKKDDEATSLATLERAGGYGSKLNSKFNDNNIQFRFQSKGPLRRFRPSKLVESASKMISGQDVLAINESINEENLDATTQVASSSNAVIEQSNSVDYNNNRPVESSDQNSLSKQPIVVADFEQDGSVQEEAFSSTTVGYEGTEAITEVPDVLVTPRPSVSNDVGGPTTVQNNQNFQIDIQKSQPYYLGKFEYVQYPSGYSDEKMIGTEGRKNMTAERIAMENIQIGATLLNFPVPEIEAIPLKPPHVFKHPYFYEKPEFVQHLPQENIKQQFAHDIETNDITVQKLPSKIANYNFKIPDQVPEQVQQVQVPVQQIPVPLPSPYPVLHTKYVEKPIEITKYVNTPIPVRVPVHIPIQVPYPVEKRVPVPVTIEKIIEKPVPVTKIVEKQIKIPYTVTKYIETPYPIHVPIPQPYPVKVPVKVPEPYPVEKVIEKKVPVPHYIEKPVPVEKIVEKPYPVQVPVPVAQPFYIHIPVEVPRAYPNIPHKAYGPPQAQPTEQIPQFVTISQARPLYQPPLNQDQKPTDTQQVYTSYTPNRAYLPIPSAKPNCDQDGASTNTKNGYYDYAGLLPPRFPAFRNVHIQQQQQQQPVRFRNIRSDFGKNLRIEYGFLPPMVPSLEIDEFGNPIDKKE